MNAEYDAILIGAGHHALVCAARLARAGWSTLVLERSDRPGGAVASGELTRPGFVHDLCATNLNLFLGSAAAAELGGELERHGLRYAHCAHPFANVFPDAAPLRVHQDRAATLAELERHDPLDAEGWRELDSLYERLSPALFSLYGSRLDGRSLAALAAAQLPALGSAGARQLIRLLLRSTRELGDAFLHSPQARALLACWGMHLDFGPDVAGGAMFPFLEAFTDMRTGISIAQGGASKLAEALAAVAEAAGAQLATGAEVVEVQLRDGAAAGVRLAGGQRVAARRAVIAGVTPEILYGRLLAGAPVPAAVSRAARAYRRGPGTMMLHLALSAPPRWSAGDDLGEFAYIHIAPYVEDLAATYRDACDGILPAEPMLVVGQTSAVDPSRAPDGAAVLWVQVRALPAQIRGDALEQIAQREWASAAGPYAERVLDKLERYAPGLRELVLDRAVLTPADLERLDANLAGGDSLAGSMHLSQNFVNRPFPEVSDYETGVPRLLMVGAATWPGAGVNAVSGFNVSSKLLASPRRGRDDARLALTIAAAGARSLASAARRAAVASRRR